MLRRHRTQQDLLRTFWMDLGWGCIFYRQSDKSQGSLMSAGQMKHVPELGTGAGLMRSFLIKVADGFHSTRREKDCEGRSPIGMIYSDHDIEKWKAPSRRTIQQHMGECFLLRGFPGFKLPFTDSLKPFRYFINPHMIYLADQTNAIRSFSGSVRRRIIGISQLSDPSVPPLSSSPPPPPSP